MSFFNRVAPKQQKFEAVTESATESEKRKAEEALLQPEPIKIYDGDLPVHKSELEERSALIVFRNKAQQDIIGELFNIRSSVKGETYITDISLLEWIAKRTRQGKFQVIDGKLKKIKKIKKSPDPAPSISDDPQLTRRRKLR